MLFKLNRLAEAMSHLLSSISLHKLYYVLWLITHQIISLALFVNRYYVKIYKSFRPKRFKESPEDIDYFVERLTKMPTHIAICVNEETLDCRRVVQVIRWCNQFHIPYVSLFSAKGLFSVNELEFYLNGTTGRITQEPTGDELSVNNNYTKINGKSKRLLNFENMKIQIVDEEDSHMAIVRAARHLCQREDDFDQDDISQFLRRTFNFPDPELMLAFGPAPTLFGYPIWQIRLTEINFVDSHRDFYYQDFCEALIKYSKCEQRFGK